MVHLKYINIFTRIKDRGCLYAKMVYKYIKSIKHVL